MSDRFPYTSYVDQPDFPDHPLLGQEIRYSFQPYHNGRGEIVRVQNSTRYEGAVTITIRVIEGTELSRLFQYSASRNNAGAELKAYGQSAAHVAECIDADRQFVYVYPV